MAAVVQAVAWAVTTVGLAIALVGLRQAQRQRLRQFESLYVKRYWDLMNRLTLPALKEDRESPISGADQLAVRAYLRLCEDELELRQAGWISGATWRVWAEGIAANLTRYPFDEVWDEVQKESVDRNRPDFSILRRFVAGETDPCTIRGARAALRGLTGTPG